MRMLIVALIIISNISYASDVVKLSGKIKNPVSDSITISYNDNKIAYYPKQYFSLVDKDGNFSLAVPVPTNTYILAEIAYGSKRADVVLKGGDSLAMSVDAAHFDSTIHYAGRGKEIQNFIALHTVVHGRMNSYMLKLKEKINEAPAPFINSIKQEEDKEIAFLNKHKDGLPGSFVNYWTAYYQYYNYFFLEQYPQIHEIIKVRRYTDTIPDINYSVLKELPLNFNDSLLTLPPYLLYLTGVFDIKLKAAGYTGLQNGFTNNFFREDSVLHLAFICLPDKSAEYFAAQNIYGNSMNEPLERIERQFASFRKRWPKSEYMTLLDKQVAISRRLAPGQPAPDFNITTIDGKESRLSKLKGKVVYLGFWASWCRQCVGEMISENKIKDLIKNKPVEFVYVSIDNDTAADRAIRLKYKIDGNFRHAEGAWNADEIQQYGVQSLPAYYLIDQDGNFASRKPPSPTEPTKLILEIERLLK